MSIVNLIKRLFENNYITISINGAGEIFNRLEELWENQKSSHLSSIFPLSV